MTYAEIAFFSVLGKILLGLMVLLVLIYLARRYRDNNREILHIPDATRLKDLQYHSRSGDPRPTYFGDRP